MKIQKFDSIQIVLFFWTQETTRRKNKPEAIGLLTYIFTFKSFLFKNKISHYAMRKGNIFEYALFCLTFL